MIRRATEADLEKLLPLAEEFIASTAYGRFPPAPSKIYATLTQMIEKGVIFVIDRDDELLGCIGGIFNELMFAWTSVASELLWYVRPSARSSESIRLHNAFEAWAKEMDCDLIHMSSLNTPSVNRYLSHNGYTLSECSFIKEL